MPAKTDDITLAGRVTDLFGHRFVIATPDGKRLADLGPHGADAVRLAVGDEVTLTGERKPSEVKVRSISVGGRSYALELAAGPRHESADAALAAIKAIGFEPLEPPSRKPKHFEILAARGGERLEFHVGFDGAIRKTKPAPKGAKP